MNRLSRLLGACDLNDVTSLRVLFHNNEGNAYDFDDIRVACEETHRSTPGIVRFVISIPTDMLIRQKNIQGWGIVFADYALRSFVRQIQTIAIDRFHVTKKEQYTGKIFIHEPNHKILRRNAACMSGEMLNISLKIRFPLYMMQKRSVVNGKLSVRIVKRELARAIRDFITEFDSVECMERIAVYQRQCQIREMLLERGYVCFIANGSILPRQENSDEYMHNAVPFISPPEDEVSITFKDGTTLSGMAIRQGVTVITGGGYSGKSTLLDAILNGIYDHIPGDGREYCITKRSSCKIAAEDGRPVSSLDIAPFIRSMPGMDTSVFSTPQASGSTSQAANIMESIAFGNDVLLIDEDRTATNFMIRDARMKVLIQNDPIVPFTDRVRQLYREADVSTVLIIGGSGEYLDIADNVYFMENYLIHNLYEKKEQTRLHPYTYYDVKDDAPICWRQDRTLASGTLTAFTGNAEPGKYKEDMTINGKKLTVGDILTDISRIESIVSAKQVNAIAWICLYLARNCAGRPINLFAEVKAVYTKIESEGLSFLLNSSIAVDDIMELPNLFDVLASISRMSPLVYQTHTKSAREPLKTGEKDEWF